MRRWFAGPEPGKERDPGGGEGEGERDEEVARGNFRVGVVLAEWVEMLDLGRGRRVWWEREGEVWRTGEVWP